MSNFNVIKKLNEVLAGGGGLKKEEPPKIQEFRDILRELPDGYLTEEEIRRLEDAFDDGRIKDITPRYIVMLSELKDAGVDTKDLFASGVKGDEKFVEVVSSYIKHVLLPRTGEPVMAETIEEGVKDIRKKYADTIPEAELDTIEQNDPTENKKYFAWMVKQYSTNPGMANHMFDLVRAFYRAGMRRQFQGQEADLNSYATIQDLDAAIESTRVRADQQTVDTRAGHEAEKKSERESMQDELVQSGEAEIAFENENVKMTIINTHEASKAFQNTPSKEGGLTWCTTREHPNYWNQYEGQGVKFYYILDKTKDRMYACAVTGTKEKPEIDVYDDNDKSISYAIFKPYLNALMEGGDVAVEEPEVD